MRLPRKQFGKLARGPFTIEFGYTLNWRDTEVDADVTAEINPGYPPSWDENWGGDPGDPGSAEILEVWVDVSDDGNAPEEISGDLSGETIAELEEAAWTEAEKQVKDGLDDYENDAYDRYNDR